MKSPCDEIKTVPYCFNGEDITGQVFTWLTVLGFVKRTRSPNGTCLYWWKCQCRCGAIVVASADKLRRGHLKSCKCYIRKITSERSTTHGESGTNKTLLYSRWLGMSNRCKNRPGYKGIRNVCERWESYENFKNDMMEGFNPALTLERRDNNKGYSPENCYWATESDQQNNKTNTTRLTLNGVTMAITYWSQKVGLSVPTIKQRLKHGWSVESALTRPLVKRRPCFAT